MILLRLVCFSVLCLCINANVSLKFIDQRETYLDAAVACEQEGGVLLMKDSQAFNKLTDAPGIPTSQEFWVGDLLYSDWILPVACLQESAVNGHSSPKNTSQIKRCYEHCVHHTFFAIKRNYCVCLDSYSTTDVQDLSICNAACDDFGLCGTLGSNSGKYLSIYETNSGFDTDVRVESPSAMGDSYMECVVANCPYSDYLGVLCNAGHQKLGLCSSTEVTSGQKAYIAALISCAQETGTYYSGMCHNTTKQYVWVGPLRFTFPSAEGLLSPLNVARGAKCKKMKTGSAYTTSCISTTENTQLPFVCKLDSDQPNTPSPTTTESNDGDGVSTTGIAGGVTGAVVAVVIVVIVMVVIINRRSKNKEGFAFSGSNGAKEQHKDPKSVYAMANGEKYDHIYAETTDVYHPYLEIQDRDVRSYTSAEYNLSQKEYENQKGNSNSGFVPETKNNSSGQLDLSSCGYLEPARTPNFGRKLPDIPPEQNRL